MNDDLLARLESARKSRRITSELLGEVKTALRSQGAAGAALERGEPSRARLSVNQPSIYGRGSGQSYFRDLACVTLRRGASDEARERLQQHAREQEITAQHRHADERRRADQLLEAALTDSPQAERAYERFVAAGYNLYDREQRFISRVDGQGGFASPPEWLTSDFTPFMRPRRVTANLVTTFPLPAGTDSINLPRISVGTATTAQPADGGAAEQSAFTDTAVSAPVRTVVGVHDASLQWVEQTGPDITGDEIIATDLTSDYDSALSGLLLLGNGGTGGQLTGLIPGGVVSNANSIVSTSSNNASGQTWLSASSGATMHTTALQGASACGRARGAPITAWIAPGWMWEYYASLLDTTGRPIVDAQYVSPPAGAIGYYAGRPLYVDEALPDTFGNTGSGAPQMGKLTAGQYPAQAGTSTHSVLLGGRFADSWLFERQRTVEVLTEVLSGTLAVRFRLVGYVAFFPARYATAAAISGFAAAGAAANYVVVNSTAANDPWQRTVWGG